MDNVLFKIGYNTSVQLIGKALSLILSIVTIGLLTRYLGTSGYGDFTLVFAYMAFFAVIADFGLQLTMVRELAGKNEGLQELYGTYFWLKIILVLLSTFLAFIFLIFFPYSLMLKTAILIGGLAVGVSGLTGYGTTIFQSKVRLDLVTFVDVLTKIVTVSLIALFIFLELGFYGIISTVLLGNLVGLGITVGLLRRNINFNFNLDRNLARKIFILSLPIGFTSLFSLAYFKLDTIILSVVRDSSEVGIYSLAYKILENVIVIWGFYMASVFPLLSKYKAENKKNKFNNLFRNSYFIAAALSFIIVPISYFAAPFIISIFAGAEFSGSATALRILIFALPLLFANNILYYRFLIKRDMYPVAASLLAALLFNFVLNITYVPKLGYIASSYITVLTELFLLSTLLFIIYLNNYRRGDA
ncbi:MAG: flippase [Candidatus Levybacteria bacterium]|nr:flippase [Candidatus Levybacteria bacterium]